jgi:hypothetical protein
MNPRMLLSLALATMSLVFATGCARDAKKKSADPIAADPTEARGQTPAAEYASLEFRPRSDQLTEQGRRQLTQFTSQVRYSGRNVQNIKILAWPDLEVKTPEGRMPAAEVVLANDRASIIKQQMREELNLRGKFVSYNMARQNLPNASKEVLGRIDPSSRTSRAIVIVEYED